MAPVLSTDVDSQKVMGLVKLRRREEEQLLRSYSSSLPVGNCRNVMVKGLTSSIYESPTLVRLQVCGRTERGEVN